jgi:hypothetical protein
MAKRKLRKPTPIPQESGLELGFLRLWKGTGLPEPEREYQFAPDRKWRLDFAWPDLWLAVEIHGGTRKRGRHNRGGGITADCEKMNAAQLAGWTVLQYTTDHMHEMPIQVVEEVARSVHERAKT